MDIGDGASLELVDMFCYVGDMLSVDGNADTAVEARVRKGWDKFRQLVPQITNKHVLLLTTSPPPPQPFYGPFSGTTRVSWCQKRTSGLYCARED